MGRRLKNPGYSAVALSGDAANEAVGGDALILSPRTFQRRSADWIYNTEENLFCLNKTDHTYRQRVCLANDFNVILFSFHVPTLSSF